MISSIRLKNFKCFREQKIPFSSLTLLTGVNGAGKSTVLQAFLLLRQSWLEDRFSKSTLALNGRFVQMGTAKDILYEDAEQDEIEIVIDFSDGESPAFAFRCGDNVDFIGEGECPDNAILEKQSLFQDGCQYLRAERLGPRTSFALSDYDVRWHRQLGPSGEYTAQFLDTFGGESVALEALLHPAASGRQLQVHAEAWLGEISPGVRFSVRKYVDLDAVSLSFSFVTPRQVRSADYRPTNVGFGITYALPIIVAVLAARPGDLLILENPEAHLHPRGQAKIGEMLSLAASNGIQILVETHSDHVLNGVRLAVKTGSIAPNEVACHFFQHANTAGPSATQLLSPKLDKNGRLDCWPTGFFDQWETSLDALLD